MSETATTAEQTAAPETAPAAAETPAQTTEPAREVAFANVDGSQSVNAAPEDDAYTKAAKEALAKLRGEDKAEKPAETSSADQKTQEAPKEEKLSGKAKAKKWWEELPPEAKQNELEKQRSQQLEKALAEVKSLREELKGLKGEKKKNPIDRDSFESDQEWLKYNIDEALLEKEKEMEKAAAARSAQAEVAKSWGEAMERQFPDPEERNAVQGLFEKNIEKMQLADGVAEYILDSRNPRLLLHLVRNPSAQKLLAPGTSALLVGARLAKIERYLDGEAREAATAQQKEPNTATPAQVKHEPLLNRASGSANNIGSSTSGSRNSSADLVADLQRRLYAS